MNNPVPQILAEGYSFKFGDYISRGFDLFKRNAWPYVGFTFLLIIILWVASIIPFASFFVQTPLMAGFFIVAHRVAMGQNPPFGDFFKGFTKFGNIIGVTFFQGLITLLCFVPALFFMFGNLMGLMEDGLESFTREYMSNPIGVITTIFDRNTTIAFLLGLIPAIYLSVSWILSYHYVWFYNMGFWQAMEASRQVVSKNWVPFFGFGLVMGLILIAGVIALGVGVLAAIPIITCSLYAAFADINKLEEDNSGSEGSISDHLIS